MVYFIQKETLTQIANSIRAKTNTTDKIDPLEMPAKIESIQTGGGDARLQEKSVTENGIVTPDAGYDGLSRVVVNVEGGAGGVFAVAGEYAVASVVDNVLVVTNGVPSGAASVITGPVGYMATNGADVTETENSLTFGG